MAIAAITWSSRSACPPSLSYVAGAAGADRIDEALTKAQAALTQANQAVADAQAAVAQAQRGGGGAGAGRAGGRGAAPGGRARGSGDAVTPDINQTPYRVDGIVPPQITGDDTFWEFLFSDSPTKFADLRARAIKGEALPPFSLADVKVTINVDNTFEVLSTQLTKNVVGMVEGSDPKLKDTYVMYGAHLDHVGYRATPPAPRAGCRPAPPDDAIYNGADDDGSGSTGLLGIAKAFATGPRPKRSVVFVWHAGEEAGLLGSHYNADFPVVPLDKVQAQFNIDMIGRNRDDNAGRVEQGVRDRRRPHQHRSAQHGRGHERDIRQGARSRFRVQRSGRSEQLLHAERPLQLCRRRASRSRSSSPARTSTTTA